MLENEIALVTGASRGIGQSIAKALGEASSVVVGTATTDAGAASITERFRATGISGRGLMLNVTDPESVAALIKQIGKEFGPPSILVNNAGITRDNLLVRMKDEEWDSVIETNLGSIYRLSKVCLRGMMKAKKGRIINIASIVGMTGNPGQANYAAAKAGMLGFTKSLAREVGVRGITVNTVAPGFIDTDMTRKLPQAQRDSMLAAIPLNRFGDPREVADAVLFLASGQAGYITGETLHVNGGMYMP